MYLNLLIECIISKHNVGELFINNFQNVSMFLYFRRPKNNLRGENIAFFQFCLNRNVKGCSN